MTAPKAFIFDVFGTLVDWRSGVDTQAAKAFERAGVEQDPYAFADAWRDKYDPAIDRVRSGSRGYVPLDILHRENLDELMHELSITDKFSEEQKQELNHAWEKLPPWPDVVDGLTALKDRAIIAPCSNGSIALMVRLAKFGRLPWDCIVGAEIAQNYKPHRDAYLRSIAALGLQPQEVVMVAAHNNDLAAAQKYALRTAFIARPTEKGANQATDLSATGEWDYIIESIGDLQFV